MGDQNSKDLCDKERGFQLQARGRLTNPARFCLLTPLSLQGTLRSTRGVGSDRQSHRTHIPHSHAPEHSAPTMTGS